MYTLLVMSNTCPLDKFSYQFTTLNEVFSNIRVLIKDDSDLIFEIWFDDK